MANNHDSLFWLLAAIQLAGVVSCFAARLWEQTASAAWCRFLFVCCLTIVGGSTMIALTCGSPCWASCGVTFCLIALAATFDFHGGMQATPF